jgi:hypothetical protein
VLQQALKTFLSGTFVYKHNKFYFFLNIKLSKICAYFYFISKSRIRFRIRIRAAPKVDGSEQIRIHNTNPRQKRDASEDGAITLTDNVQETCLFICDICQKPVSSVEVHAEQYHELSAQIYRTLFRNIRYQRKTHHRYRYSCSSFIRRYCFKTAEL